MARQCVWKPNGESASRRTSRATPGGGGGNCKKSVPDLPGLIYGTCSKVYFRAYLPGLFSGGRFVDPADEVLDHDDVLLPLFIGRGKGVPEAEFSRAANEAQSFEDQVFLRTGQFESHNGVHERFHSSGKEGFGPASRRSRLSEFISDDRGESNRGSSRGHSFRTRPSS